MLVGQDAGYLAAFVVLNVPELTRRGFISAEKVLLLVLSLLLLSLLLCVLTVFCVGDYGSLR